MRAFILLSGMGWLLNVTPEVEAQSQYPIIIAVCVVLSVLSVIIVGLRLHIRQRGRQKWAMDDMMAALSIVFALLYSILCIAQTKYGLGLPLNLRPQADLVIYTRLNFAGRPIYQMGISFFKVALLISYLRIFKGVSQTLYYQFYYKLIQSVIVVVLLAHLACALSLILACSPVDRSWNPLKEGSCLSQGASFTAYAAVTIVSDILVAVLPLPVFLRLSMRREKKFGLAGIFLLGLFTTICSILRYRQIDRIQYGDGNSTMLVLWGTIEFNVGNMVSSLPFLAPVLIRKTSQYISKQSNNTPRTPFTKSGASDNRSQTSGTENSKRTDVYGLGGTKAEDQYKLRSLSGDREIFARGCGDTSSDDLTMESTSLHVAVKSVISGAKV